MIKVLLVDDQRLIRNCLSVALARSGQARVVGEAENGEQARLLLRQTAVDVVVMDLSMPGMGGVETTRRLVAQRPGLRVLGLSQHVEGVLPARFIEAGGAGYVSKQASTEEMLLALRRVHAGQRYLSADVASSIAAERAPEPPRRTRPTRRELEVLRLISAGLDLPHVAETLSLSPKTVATHRRNLLRRLCVSNDVQLAARGRQMGLVTGFE
jgi:two-component system, NarL family, invasion response regulator UvrY